MNVAIRDQNGFRRSHDGLRGTGKKTDRYYEISVLRICNTHGPSRPNETRAQAETTMLPGRDYDSARQELSTSTRLI
jgi:hypothetical protein